MIYSLKPINYKMRKIIILTCQNCVKIRECEKVFNMKDRNENNAKA